MYILLNMDTNIEIEGLSESSKFKQIFDKLNVEINKSRLAREFGGSHQTIEKHLNGSISKKGRNKSSKIDGYYGGIVLLLSEDSKKSSIIVYYGST